MTEIHDNVLDDQQIKILLDWFNQHDTLVDDRLDVRSKTPVWDTGQWPQDLVKQVLDKVLPEPYRVEVVLFYGSRISLRLHADSGDDDGQRPYKNVIIPLHVEGPASTVVFDNHWHGVHARFARVPVSPFAYNLPDRHGNMQHIPDIRQLLTQCLQQPALCKDFDVTQDFVELLQRIVAIRSGQGSRAPDGFVSDYSTVVNYQPTAQFDSTLHEQYLSHVAIENLHGLTIERVAPWCPGQAITFDRSQLHCAGSGHRYKIGISIFTYRY